MHTNHLKSALAAAIAVGLSAGGTAATAATWQATQDTYVYEFLGNQGATTGDSGGILVWNHETTHGAQALLQFDAGWTGDAALSGAYTATLNLYQTCDTSSGFVGACPGDAGAESTTTDILLQSTAWTEGDAALTWGDISSTSTPSTSFTQTSASGWLSVDITSLVSAWLGGADDYGLALSQEAYSVIRADNGSVAVSSFCDSESTSAACTGGSYAPYLEISSVSAVPVPAAVWLFGSGLVGLMTVGRRRFNATPA